MGVPVLMIIKMPGIDTFDRYVYWIVMFCESKITGFVIIDT